MGSSCEIIGTLGVITIGGVSVAGTLCGGTVIGTLGGAIIGTSLVTTLVWVFFGCMVLKSFSNILIVCIWHSPIVKEVFVPGFFSTCFSSLTDLVSCSVENNTIMMRCCGKNFTTST